MIDFIIIGGGIIGTSMAHELGKYQLAVVLLEKEAELSQRRFQRHIEDEVNHGSV